MVKIDYKEYGTKGLDSNFGFITQAYITDLTWPTVQPLFSRLRRSDPEVSLVRNIFLTFARNLKLSWTAPQKYSEDQVVQEAIDFGNSVLDDLDGGQDGFIETMVSHVPFYGWGWWEVVPGVRDPSWQPPGDDPWRSLADDGKIGIRRFAFRDSSSFQRWNVDDRTGRLRGLVQQDYPNPSVTLPLERSLHLTYGDSNSPEGLSPLEAIYRLERIKYGLEVVQGIGYEHSAGHVNIETELKKMDAGDKAMLKEIVRSLLTAQEGNFIATPKDMKASFIDAPFSAATSILDAVKYYGILKLMVYMAQWVSLSSVTGSGSYAAMGTSAEMFITYFNAMMKGFTKQVDRQIGPKLYYEYNQFDLPVRPTLSISSIDKNIQLSEAGQFLTAIQNIMEFTEDDIEAIRKSSGFLPEQPSGEVVSRPGDQVNEVSNLSHDPVVVNHICPECGNSQAFRYPDHKGLLVCTKCLKTYDPEKE